MRILILLSIFIWDLRFLYCNFVEPRDCRTQLQRNEGVIHFASLSSNSWWNIWTALKISSSKSIPLARIIIFILRNNRWKLNEQAAESIDNLINLSTSYLLRHSNKLTQILPLGTLLSNPSFTVSSPLIRQTQIPSRLQSHIAIKISVTQFKCDIEESDDYRHATQ